MSTRVELAHGENYYVYNDLRDDEDTGAVYIQMRGDDIIFCADRDSCTIRIPSDVWKRINNVQSDTYDALCEIMAAKAYNGERWLGKLFEAGERAEKVLLAKKNKKCRYCKIVPVKGTMDEYCQFCTQEE